MRTDKPCKHGHFDCATVEGGKCSDEALHADQVQEAALAYWRNIAIIRAAELQQYRTGGR